MTTTELTYDELEKRAIVEQKRLKALEPMQPAINKRAEKIIKKMSEDSDKLLKLMGNLHSNEQLNLKGSLFVLLGKNLFEVEKLTELSTENEYYYQVFKDVSKRNA